MNLTKCCTKCGEEKGLDEFREEKRMKDGRSSWCRECYRSHNREREARRWASDPGFREKKNAYERKRRDSDHEREKSAKYVRERRASDPVFRETLAARARAIPRSIKLVYERAYEHRRRENEEFEAFMSRMEQEAAEWEAANNGDANEEVHDESRRRSNR